MKTITILIAVFSLVWTVSRSSNTTTQQSPNVNRPAAAVAHETVATRGLQATAGTIPCPSCGATASLPSVLRLNGVDHTGRAFANVPLVFQCVIPPSPSYPEYDGGLRYVGSIPSVSIGGIDCAIVVTFNTGIGPPVIPSNYPACELVVQYIRADGMVPIGLPQVGRGAGIMDCGSKTFTTPTYQSYTPMQGPFHSWNLPGGMTVSP